MINEEKLAQIFQNQDFADEAKEIANIEDMRKLFSKYGLDLTEEEVTDLCIQIGKEASKEELDEADLEEVSGGFAITASVIALGVVCVGAFAIGVYNGYKSQKKK